MTPIVRTRCQHCYDDIVEDSPGAAWRGRLSFRLECVPGTGIEHTPLPIVRRSVM
jgi:hypothetical protein